MNILIVDDEMMIKGWLCHTISSLPYEIQLLDVASNGEEALMKVENAHYDLIFIDIMMPKMNGLELLIELNKKSLNSDLIVLSSHDEFKFAKEAIKYNVKEYVLKNECSKEKLSEILQECQDKLSSAENSNSLNSELIAKVLGNEFPASLVEQLKKNFPSVAGSYTFVVVLGSEIKDELLEQTYSFDCKIKKEGVIGRTDDNCFILFSLVKPQTDFNVGQITQTFARYLAETLKEKVSISKICQDYATILRECREGWIGYRSLFFSDTGYCWGVNKFKEYDAVTVGNLCDKTIAAIRSYSKEETVASIEKLHAYFNEVQPTDIEFVKNTYSALLSTFVIYNNKEAKVIAEKLETVLSTIHSFDSYKVLTDWVSSTIDNDSDLIRRNKFSPPVEEALRFIEKNYASIGFATEIADHVNLSLDYFSRVFKKEMGITISSYIIHYRLDKASVMLKSSNLSIKEIAQKVGIENVSYFSKSFRKKFHIQPIGFRIQAKNQADLDL